MAEPNLTIAELLRQDKRYKIEAYALVFDALRYGHEVLGMGAPRSEPESSASDDPPPESGKPTGNERHLTGQELCEAIRRFAIEQYGYMARCVLGSWGVHSTGDFGEIVFNLIRVGEMRKTDDDRREDFDKVFDFDTAFEATFEMPRAAGD
jgi:uncharacterized repeat protein (TIGR04138 family)